MEKRNNFTYLQKPTVGDLAVDGLLAGAAAGLVMLCYLLVAALWQGTAITALLAHFVPGPDGSPLAGAAAHLAVSGIYGALFTLAAQLLVGRSRLPSLLLGITYGLLLLALARIAVLPGADLGLADFPALHLTLAHLLYGVSLAWLWQRNER